jgi:glycogen debranching enzyme
MPIEIQVGPPEITISNGRTFMVTNQRGEIELRTAQGVYSIDTRFVSCYALFINRVPLTLINSSQLSFYAARYHLTNPHIETEQGDLNEYTIGIRLDRRVGEGIHEEIELVNYTGAWVAFLFQVQLMSDFADLFEVKSGHVVQRGQLVTQWDQQQRRFQTTYDNQDFHRAVTYEIGNAVPVHYANGRLQFSINLEAGQSWHVQCQLRLDHGQSIQQSGTAVPLQPATTASSAIPPHSHEPRSDFDERQAYWQEHTVKFFTSNHQVWHMGQQAIVDMGALRIYDMDISDDAWIPAAGVPWFVTLFGRDSLIAALQNIATAPAFAHGALRRLADYQATERDDWREAQPGKILHEIRFGELAHFKKVPFTPFYGTADATILYLIVLSEAYRWTADLGLLQEFRDAAERCLAWIDHYGDLDGDGFQEYKSFSPYHYENIGWKDAGDAVVYADGRQVKQPKALCELQGYVYDAKIRMAEVFGALGDDGRAETLRQQAQELKRRFNEVFWMEDEGCFAFGLDPDKQLITTIASNAGHCLWSRIADQDKGERTGKRLLQPDMWSGWGIRTLSKNNPAYNPYEYQRGSIWPQDNAFIANGFKRYGLTAESNKVIRGIFDAIERFQGYRPPEVFAGLDRQGDLDFPVLYPRGANIPQAWASGSIFFMLGTMLGLRADAPNRRLYLIPTLPEWLPDVELRQLRVGPCSLDIRFWREGEQTRWEVIENRLDSGRKTEEIIQVLSL